MSTILKTENITKDYGEGRGAIDISIEIKSKEIVGFIGPNGAGKTTTLSMLTHLITPNYGSYSLFNKKIESEADYLSVADKIGSLPSEGGLYESLTARKLLTYAASLYDCSVDQIDELASNFKLDLDKKIRNLSLGNKRKVGLIQSLLHNPKLLILDEPTSGLDPLIQKQVLEIIRKVKERGGAVLLSSHNLAEVESICDRVIMIKAGKIIFSGKTIEILKKSLKRFRIENVSKEVYREVEKLESVKRIEYIADDVIAYVDDPREILEYLRKKNNYNFYLERPTLEEAFSEYYQ